MNHVLPLLIFLPALVVCVYAVLLNEQEHRARQEDRDQASQEAMAQEHLYPHHDWSRR